MKKKPKIKVKIPRKDRIPHNLRGRTYYSSGGDLTVMSVSSKRRISK